METSIVNTDFTQEREDKQKPLQYKCLSTIESPKSHCSKMTEQEVRQSQETLYVYDQYLVLQKKSAIRRQTFSLADVEGVSEQDRPFLVLNKDTGEVFDVRQESVVSNLLSLSARYCIKRSAMDKKLLWKDFWSYLNYLHEELVDTAIEGCFEKLQLLLGETAACYPIDVNHKDFDDMTALHYSALEGHTECVKYLLENGANIEAVTQFRRKPIHFAALRGHTEVLDVLLSKREQQCELDAPDREFNTPLHLACENGHVQAVQLLLQCGANPQCKNFQNLCPLELTTKQQIIAVFQKCCEAQGAPAVQQSYSKQRKEYVERMLQFKNSKRKGAAFGVQQQRKEIDLLNTLSAIEVCEKLSPEDFYFYKLLGKGAFGEVFLVKMRQGSDQQFYAMKVLEKDKIKRLNLMRYAKIENSVMRTMRHPFIVKLRYSFQTKTGLYLVMRFCPGGDLAKLLDKCDRLSEKDTRICVGEILLALQALHRQNIIFRDLKPANVLIDQDGHFLLSDFGLANERGTADDVRQSFCGTPAYLAPEMIKKEGHNRMIDWYLLGVLLYECLTGITPYYANNKKDLFELILKGPLKLPASGISNNAKDLIIKLLQRNPKKRLGYESDGEDIKKHPFFKGLNWNDLYARKLRVSVEPKWTQVGDSVQALQEPNQSMDVIKVSEWSFLATNIEMQSPQL